MAAGFQQLLGVEQKLGGGSHCPGGQHCAGMPDFGAVSGYFAASETECLQLCFGQQGDGMFEKLGFFASAVQEQEFSVSHVHGQRQSWVSCAASQVQQQVSGSAVFFTQFQCGQRIEHMQYEVFLGAAQPGEIQPGIDSEQVAIERFETQLLFGAEAQSQGCGGFAEALPQFGAKDLPRIALRQSACGSRPVWLLLACLLAIKLCLLARESISAI